MTCIVISMASFPVAVQQIRVSSREEQSLTSTAQNGLPRQRKEVKPQLPKVGNVIMTSTFCAKVTTIPCFLTVLFHRKKCNNFGILN